MSAPLASIRVQAANTRKTFDDIGRSTERATMYAVREAGRFVKTVGRREAPVYKGRAGVSRKQASAGRLAVNANAPVKGLLRSSISSGKSLHRSGVGTYSVRVAPRGERVHLYSQKIEASAHFMAKAHAAVGPELGAIAARSWARAHRKG